MQRRDLLLVAAMAVVSIPAWANVNPLEARVAELERKVAGMQKQITLLHAKKADKPLSLTEERERLLSDTMPGAYGFRWDGSDFKPYNYEKK